MGNLFGSRPAVQNEEECDSLYYYYPPRVANKFFASTFLIGGEKFEMSTPESYLFGDNFDLNYLGGKPARSPYNCSPSTLGQPITQMIRSLINIRKETLKLFPLNNSSDTPPEEMQFFIEFVYDADVDFQVTVHFICDEECSPEGLKYNVRNEKNVSETFHYKAGTGQVFSETSSVFNPNNYHASQLIYQILDEKGEFNPEIPYPVVIYCVAEEGPAPRQSHSLIGAIEKIYDNAFSLKPLKQKIFIDGLAYLLQEIYGIENKTNKTNKAFDEDSNHSYECVICMSELRDTLILPCRHLCLCKHCANSLRYQANNCPICRVPFRALLQIKAIQFTFLEGLCEDTINVPHGYQQVALVEALNGPIITNIGPHPLYPNGKKGRGNMKIPVGEHPHASRSHSESNERNNDENITTFKQIDDSDYDKEDSKIYEEQSKHVNNDVVINQDSTSASSSSSSSSSAQRTHLLDGNKNANDSQSDDQHHNDISSHSNHDDNVQQNIHSTLPNDHSNQ